MKKQGITLIQVVITILVMLILATVAILYGVGVPKETNVASVYNEIKEIESAIKEGYMLGKIKVSQDGTTLSIWGEYGAPKATLSSSDITKMGLDSAHDYYQLNFSSSRELKDALEIENVKNDYLLDFENLNIYLIKGIDLFEEEGQTAVTRYNSDDIESYYLHVFD